jgi:AcrR family transcriptional regulator
MVKKPDKKNPDRRIRRTRKLLQDALISLMIENGYEDVTVQDIIDRADVGRATFYAHFADKRTLLASRIEDLRSALSQQQRQAGGGADQGDTRFAFSLPMLEHAREHLPLYSALVGRESGAFVMQRIHEMVADLVRDDLIGLGFARSSEKRDLLVQHVAGGFMAVMTWWLEHGAKQSAIQVDSIFRRLAMQGVAPELRLD